MLSRARGSLRLQRGTDRSGRWLGCATVLAAGLSGCRGTPLAAEQEARSDLQAVGRMYRPDGRRPTAPALSEHSTLRDYLTFAMLNSPQVEAGYFDWAASVERITSARSLPDPRLTFESDIADSVLTLMPGLMIDLPGPGKLRASGDVAAAGSRGMYFMFEQALLRTAYEVKTAYYRLHFLEQNIQVQQWILRLLTDLERLAEQQNAAGRGTLRDVLSAQIEREQVQTQLADLADSRGTLLAQFKAALGLRRDEPDPPLPEQFEGTPEAPDAEALWAAAQRRNPMIRRLEADVEQAMASLALARTTAVPDFSVGVEADVKASPIMVRPSGSVTLPIWRDKIEAEIAAAQAGHQAAEARLSAEQIRLAAELAAMLYQYRQSVRNIALLQDRLIPRAGQSLDAARTGYVAARSGFLDVIDAERSLRSFELSLIEARTQRELALASLSLLMAGLAPDDAPILPTSMPPAPRGAGHHHSTTP